MLLNSLLLPNERNPRDGGAGGDLEIAFVNKSRGSKGHKELNLKRETDKCFSKRDHREISALLCVTGATGEVARRGVWGA